MVLAVALCVVAAGCTETQSSRAQSSRAQTRPTQAPQSEATTREGPTEQAVPARGKPRPPQARLSGRPVWVAPDPAQEPHLRRVSGPLPAAIDLDQAYPELTPGSVERALLAMTVVDDTSAVRRILILDVAGQVYEISSLAQTADVRMPIELSPDGTGLRFGYVDGPVTLELLRPSLLDEGAPPAARPPSPAGVAGLRFRGWRGASVQSPSSNAVARVADSAGLRGVATDSDRPQALVVDGPRRGVLVLDGQRSAYCCKVAGWLSPDQVMVETRAVDQLRLLSWDVRTGRVGLLSEISPVVGPDWFVATSYADLTDH